MFSKQNCRTNAILMEYEHTPRQMAEKLMEFNRDFSDNEDDVKSETEYLIKLFDELQNSEQFNITP